MKETKNWLPTAQKKAQTELTFLRKQVRGIDLLSQPDRSPDIIQQRREISTEIKMLRKNLRAEKFKAVLRGDLSPEMYRPSVTKKMKSADIVLFDIQTTDSEQRQLLLVS
jgi:hypothetical protein